jgi:hypothetical protein
MRFQPDDTNTPGRPAEQRILRNPVLEGGAAKFAAERAYFSDREAPVVRQDDDGRRSQPLLELLNFGHFIGSRFRHSLLQPALVPRIGLIHAAYPGAIKKDSRRRGVSSPGASAGGLRL